MWWMPSSFIVQHSMPCQAVGVPSSTRAGRIAHPALRARTARSRARRARRLSPPQARAALRRRRCSRSLTRDAADAGAPGRRARARAERAACSTLAREIDPAVFAPARAARARHRRDRARRAPVGRLAPRCSPTRGAAPVVLLEDPRDLGNMGACVRVAAAADAAGVLSTGSHDPWHPDALRGAAGLHYARARRTPAAPP